MRRTYSCFAIMTAALVLTAAVLNAVWDDLDGNAPQIRHLERQLGADLPAEIQLEYEDSHGGFHGDGVLTATVTFPSQKAVQEFAGQLDAPWSSLPVEPSELSWAVHRAWSSLPPLSTDLRRNDLPPVTRGYWFCQDRYQEQYGEVCAFNPYLQNATFALLDTQAGVLYVLEIDC